MKNKIEKISLDEYIVEIIDSPNQILDKREKDLLVAACIPVARKGFKNDKVTESDIETHAIEVDTGIYIRNKDGKIIAFSGCAPEHIKDNLVVHLKGTAVLPEYQSNGLYNILTPTRILREAEKIGTNFYIGSRTQNPRVFEYMNKVLGLFPRIDSNIPENIKSIAEQYAILVREKHSDPSFLEESRKSFHFDPKTLVVRRAYAGCMYGDNIPKAKDDNITKFISKHLDFNNGDVLILFGDFNKKTYLDSLAASKPDRQKKLYKRFLS